MTRSIVSFSRHGSAASFASGLSCLLVALMLVWAGCSDALLTPDAELHRLKLEPSSSLVSEGDSVSVSVQVLDGNGNPIEDPPGWSEGAVEWKSQNADVVSVSEIGDIEAVGSGKAVLRATYGDLNGTTTLRVNPSSVSVSLDASIEQNGQTHELTDELQPYQPLKVIVSVEADEENFFKPDVFVELAVDGTIEETYTVRAPLPLPLDASSLPDTEKYVVDVPAAHVEPGLSIRATVDRNGALPIRESSRSLPADGSLLGLNVIELPSLEIKGFHITQSTQRVDGSVPLVADRDGLMRVFLRGNLDLPDLQPDVRAWFYHNGSLVKEITISSSSNIPAAVDPSTFRKSWNAIIPGELIQPGMEVKLLAKPEQAATSGDPRLYPRDGSTYPVRVEQIDPFDIVIVPVEYTPTGDRGNVTSSNKEMWLRDFKDMFPVAEVRSTVGVPFQTNTQPTTFENWAEILGDISALQVADGQGRYFYGLLPSSVTQNYGGLGFRPGYAAIGYDRNVQGEGIGTLAHELGHNLDRRHTPCGDPAGVDSGYPYADANIGVIGYNVRTDVVHEPEFRKDLMSYCDPVWISDYTYEGVLDYLVSQPNADKRLSSEQVLLVRGYLHDRSATLAPAFPLDAPPRLPSGEGAYVIEAVDARGDVLYSSRFAGEPITHAGNGGRGFTFAIPTRYFDMRRLAGFRVRGGGVTGKRLSTQAARRKSAPLVSVTREARRTHISWDAKQYPSAMVRDAQTGDIISFMRGGSATIRGDSPVRVIFSDGVDTITRELRP